MEAKGQYFCEDASGSPSEMTNATRARATLEGGSNCLKGKEDEVQRRQEQLVLHEAAIKHEEELQTRGQPSSPKVTGRKMQQNHIFWVVKN